MIFRASDCSWNRFHQRSILPMEWKKSTIQRSDQLQDRFHQRSIFSKDGFKSIRQRLNRKERSKNLDRPSRIDLLELISDLLKPYLWGSSICKQLTEKIGQKWQTVDQRRQTKNRKRINQTPNIKNNEVRDLNCHFSFIISTVGKPNFITANVPDMNLILCLLATTQKVKDSSNSY